MKTIKMNKIMWIFAGKQKVAVTILSIMVTLFFMVSSCKSDRVLEGNTEELLTETFMKNLENVPVVVVPRGELSEWLNERIDGLIESYVGKFIGLGMQVSIFRGEWKDQTVYLIQHPHSSCLFCFIDEKGEPISFSPPSKTIDINDTLEDILLKSENWEIIFQIVDGEIVDGSATRSSSSDYSAKIVDKYEFPDISRMNDWQRPNIIQERLDALQIPDAVLATISTEGLLATCLEFPYLINIFHSNDFQQGFNSLVLVFNGFREILKRPDLTTTLIEKYYWISEDVKGLGILCPIEQGRFSFRYFVFEFMLAQDIFLKNLSEEQERQLFLLSLEHKKIKNSYPDVFSDLNGVPTILLYAKKILNDNQARADMKSTLLEFVQAPVYVEQNVINYLNDYVNVKFK